MFLRAIPVIALVASLSACGGSSDGSAVNPVRPPTPAPTPTPVPSNAQVLRTFANGDGVARTAVTLDGDADIANALVRNVAGVVTLVNRDGLTINSVTSTNLGSDGLSTRYIGTSTINGVLVDVQEIYDDFGPSYAILVDDGSGDFIAGGSRVSNIPAGSYTYTGANVVANRDLTVVENGTFEMLVDFTNATANILGSTATSAISGNMSVNNQTGTFTGNNMLLSTTLGSSSATMLGNFHGDAAKAVSGVYYDNSPNPVVAGAIVGSR